MWQNSQTELQIRASVEQTPQPGPPPSGWGPCSLEQPGLVEQSGLVEQRRKGAMCGVQLTDTQLDQELREDFLQEAPLDAAECHCQGKRNGHHCNQGSIKLDGPILIVKFCKTQTER